MNASVEKWRPRATCRQRPVAMISALLLLGGGQMGGCADIHRATFLPPVNPESPVAGVVAAAAMENYKRPNFASVPPKPLNVPPPEAVKTAVIDMVRCRRAYEVWVADHPALVSGTGEFAESLQAQLDNDPNDRPTPEQKAAAEADAAKLLAYVAPPPPMHSGPPPTASQAAPPVVKTASAQTARPPPRAAPAKTAAAPIAATPAPRSVASAAPASTVQKATPRPASETIAAQTGALQEVAAAQPSMTPVHVDPILAHCQ